MPARRQDSSWSMGRVSHARSQASLWCYCIDLFKTYAVPGWGCWLADMPHQFENQDSTLALKHMHGSHWLTPWSSWCNHRYSFSRRLCLLVPSCGYWSLLPLHTIRRVVGVEQYQDCFFLLIRDLELSFRLSGILQPQVLSRTCSWHDWMATSQAFASLCIDCFKEAWMFLGVIFAVLACTLESAQNDRQQQHLALTTASPWRSFVSSALIDQVLCMFWQCIPQPLLCFFSILCSSPQIWDPIIQMWTAMVDFWVFAESVQWAAFVVWEPGTVSVIWLSCFRTFWSRLTLTCPGW